MLLTLNGDIDQKKFLLLHLNCSQRLRNYHQFASFVLPITQVNYFRHFPLAEEDDFKHVLFQDNLVTVSDTGKELGEFTVSIEQARHQGIECFLVHANSHGAIDNVPCGTSITTYVSQKLETLEQHHHEYVKVRLKICVIFQNCIV